jgi:membrane fusion protein, multidrug efflux system
MKNAIFSLRMLPVVITALMLVKCGAHSQQTVTTEDTIPVKLQPVVTADYSPVLKYSGIIASKTEARPSFKINGIIDKIYVKEGDHVVKGQLLATLNLTEINAQVQQSVQNVEKSKRDVARIQNLYNDTVATLEQLQNVNTQLNVAGEGLRIAQFNRQYAQVHAPQDGVILKKLMNEGELASSGTPVFQLIGTSSGDWVVRFGMADKDWAVVKKGDKAVVHIDAYPGKTFTGIVTEVADAADQQGGTYETEVKILPDGNKLAPGLFSGIQLHTAGQQKISFIPIEALTEGDGNTGFVYVLNEDKKTVTRKPVTIAFIEKDRIAVSGGLENVTEVITEGVSYLTPNAIVKAIK